MKFVHIADVHFDSPFTGLDSVGNLGDIRRLEQRKAFKKVIDYIKENNVEYFFIAGDLYEHQYVKKSTIEYINKLFMEISDTKIFITPGNHDPYIKGSYYEEFEWSENVYICREELDLIEEPDVDIYMNSFANFYMNESQIQNIKIQNPNKKNILITHCDLNGARDKDGFSYNPILESKINGLGFDYVAMGHIHKNNFSLNNRAIYPGSLISFGFDELDEHGMIVGEIDDDVNLSFVKIDDRIFAKYELNVENLSTKEELVEKVNCLNLDENTMYEVILVGNREFDISARELLKLVDVQNILKIKDCTKLKYDIEKIAKENNLRGIFIREILKKYKTGMYTEEQIEKAIEIGLQVME